MGALLIGSVAARLGGGVIRGVVMGGIWMVGSCVVIAWVGMTALRYRSELPRVAALFLLAMLGSALAGGALLVCLRPSPLGAAAGASAALAVFFYQLRQLWLHTAAKEH